MSDSQTDSQAAAAPPQGELLLPEWLVVSSSPHLKTGESVKRIMWTVNATLAPMAVWAAYWFGWHALALMVVCTLTAVAAEWAVQRVRKIPVTAWDGSAFLTGLLLAFCVPPDLPLWMAALGSAFAVFVAKQAFGGLGQNVFNPAHIGRAFLLASFPVAMTTWSAVQSGAKDAVDGITTATPLGVLKEHGWSAVTEHFGSGGMFYAKLFFGSVNGSLGEVSAFLILAGGLVLVAKKYIRWEGPAVYIGTVGVLSWAFSGPSGLFSGNPLFAILSGGLFLGAFYMITDYVTTPITLKGQVIFAFCAGFIVWLIRRFGGYPEGVCYSILLMNCFTPLIDRLVRPKRYGWTGGKA